jgi:hypothetical protein
MIRIYQRRQLYPIAVPGGTAVSLGRASTPDRYAVLCVTDAATQVLARIPLDQVVGWAVDLEPHVSDPGARVYLRGREAAVPIGPLVSPPAPDGGGRAVAPFDAGWQPFTGPDGRCWAAFRADELDHWEPGAV